ncbi:MAG: hypothetical protein SFY81_05975 [Verrucomicrobiota bacterium]|nr:hypothetical protein [Verrucomicrobiota bacterium]
MSGWSFAASPGIVLVALLVWLGSGYVCWLLYQRSGKRSAVGRLELLRFLLITLLALTLLRPEYVRTYERTEKPHIQVLVDGSGSMETRDLLLTNQVQTRAEWVETRIASAFWKPWERNARVLVEEFSTTPNAATNTLPGTDINAALERVLRADTDLKAVVVLSDGDWNQGKSPLAAASIARERDVPIFTVSTGSEQPLPDLALEWISPPSYGLFGEQITIPFRVKSHLPREVKIPVILSSGGQEEVRREIVVPAHSEMASTILYYPRKAGEVSLNLSFPVQEGEIIPENNARDFSMNIRLGNLKVLVIDSLPRWEYRFLRNALARDPAVELHCLLMHPGMPTGSGRDYIPSFPSSKELISRYDVIFLGDVGLGQGELTLEQCELIKGVVEQQASGLVFLPGKRGRLSSLTNSPLGELIPVVLDQERSQGVVLVNESALALSSSGRKHLLTRFDPEENRNEEIWNQLPGFFWSAAVERSRPGSEVLAVHSSLRNSSGRMPLLVTREAGMGKVLFMGTDAAWRWRRGVEDKYHYRFWSQVVRWMSHQRHLSEREGIRLIYSPEAPRRGDTLFLQASVLDKSGFPLEQGEVSVTITSPSGRSEHLPLLPSEEGWGVFQNRYVAQEGGDYNLAVIAEKEERRLETKINVSQPQLEVVGRPINRAIFQEISQISGGTNIDVSAFDQLVKQISVLPEPRARQKRHRLWSSPWLGAGILLLLTLYWIGRKRAGLI